MELNALSVVFEVQNHTACLQLFLSVVLVKLVCSGCHGFLSDTHSSKKASKTHSRHIEDFETVPPSLDPLRIIVSKSNKIHQMQNK